MMSNNGDAELIIPMSIGSSFHQLSDRGESFIKNNNSSQRTDSECESIRIDGSTSHELFSSNDDSRFNRFDRHDIEINVKNYRNDAGERLFRIEHDQSSHTIAIDHSSHYECRTSNGKLGNILLSPTPITLSRRINALISTDEDDNDDEDIDVDVDEYDDDDDTATFPHYSTPVEQQSLPLDRSSNIMQSHRSNDRIMASNMMACTTTTTDSINNDTSLFYPRSSNNHHNNTALFSLPPRASRIPRNVGTIFVNEKVKSVKENWLDVDEGRPATIGKVVDTYASTSFALPPSPRIGRSPLLTPLVASSSASPSPCVNSRINSPALRINSPALRTTHESPRICPYLPNSLLSSIGQSSPLSSSSPSACSHKGGISFPLSPSLPLLSPNLSRRLSPAPRFDVTSSEQRLGVSHPLMAHSPPTPTPISKRVDVIRSTKSPDNGSHPLDGSISTTLTHRTATPIGHPSTSTLSSPRCYGNSPFLTPLLVSNETPRVDSRKDSPPPVKSPIMFVTDTLTAVTLDPSILLFHSLSEPANTS